MMEWFTGVVEDINDPRQLNRVRVRCFGYHTEDRSIITTGDLPWATIMNPTNTAGTSGLGTLPHGLLPGSWVVGFFRDGKSAQDPIVMGSIASQSDTKPDSGTGFSDSTGTYPTSDYIGEPDVHKMARGENTYDYKPDAEIAEPASPFAAEYPYNKVTATTSGHVIEMDDTPEAERIRILHKSGALIEIHPNGDIVHRNGNRWQVVAGNDRIHVTGEVQIKVEGDANVKVGGNVRMDTKGTMRVASGGNMTLVAPRIDFNPPGASVGTINPALIDLPVNFQQNIQTIDVVPEGYPANPEQVEPSNAVYEPLAPATCGDVESVNPYNIAKQALEQGSDVWTETGSNPRIKALWDEIGYNGSQYADQTAWCAVFVGAILKRAGMKYFQSASSQAYSSYGEGVNNIEDIKKGDLVIFYRGGVNSGKGHVGFATGNYTSSTIEILGGNQGNTLKIANFKRSNPDKGWGIKSIRRAVTCDLGEPAPDSDYEQVDGLSQLETQVT